MLNTAIPRHTHLRHSDGRSARAARTRDAVIGALLELLDEGNLRPTARQLAERAGVSLRSVFQHFEELESLYAEVADRQIARIAELTLKLPNGGPLESRIREFVVHRTQMLEAISPVRRAALLQAPFSPEIARRLRWVHELARQEIERVFAAEIGSWPPRARKEVIAALDVAAGWYTWETLRKHDGLSENASRSVMSRMLNAILKERS